MQVCLAIKGFCETGFMNWIVRQIPPSGIYRLYPSATFKIMLALRKSDMFNVMVSLAQIRLGLVESSVSSMNCESIHVCPSRTL